MTDYLPGGELFDKIMHQKSFSEKEASAVIEVLARTLQTLHKQLVFQRVHISVLCTLPYFDHAAIFNYRWCIVT